MANGARPRRWQGWTLVLACAPLAAHGAAPLVTEDASILPPETCQLEAWVQANGPREAIAQPACNLFANIEWTFGATRAEPADAPRSSQLLWQAKSAAPLAGSADWSAGWVFDVQRDTGAPRGGSAYQLYALRGALSWSPVDPLELDFNAGAANQYGAGTYALANAAVQYEFAHGWVALGEVYRDAPGAGKYQVGLRYVVIADRFELFTSYGDKLGERQGHWYATFGLRLQTAPHPR